MPILQCQSMNVALALLWIMLKWAVKHVPHATQALWSTLTKIIVRHVRLGHFHIIQEGIVLSAAPAKSPRLGCRSVQNANEIKFPLRVARGFGVRTFTPNFLVSKSWHRRQI